MPMAAAMSSRTTLIATFRRAAGRPRDDARHAAGAERALEILPAAERVR